MTFLDKLQEEYPVLKWLQEGKKVIYDDDDGVFHFSDGKLYMNNAEISHYAEITDWLEDHWKIYEEPKLRPWTWEELIANSDKWFVHKEEPDEMFKAIRLDVANGRSVFTYADEGWSLDELKKDFKFFNPETKQLEPCGVAE